MKILPNSGISTGRVTYLYLYPSTFFIINSFLTLAKPGHCTAGWNGQYPSGIRLEWVPYRATGEGLLYLGSLEERACLACLYFPFPYGYSVRVVPLLWPCSYRVPRKPSQKSGGQGIQLLTYQIMWYIYTSHFLEC